MPDQEAVAGRDGIDRDFIEASVDEAHGHCRHAADQRRHRALRSARSIILEQLPAGIHQRNDIGGERFAEGEGGGHREERDGIESEVAAPQRSHHLDRERDERR
jgi:hypothetical protein